MSPPAQPASALHDAPDADTPAPAADGAAAAPPEAPKGGEVRSRAMRGSMWTLVGHAGANLTRFAANLLLTRLLFPEAFGVMALVNVFLQGLHMFADVGIGISVIQSKRGDDPAFVQTAWTLQALRGLYLFVVAALIGYPLSLVYGIPDLAWMVPVAGSTALIEGFSSMALFTQNRALNLGRVTATELLSTVIAASAMCITAYFTRSIVSLLVNGLVAAALRMAFSHLLLRGVKHRFAWEPEARKEILQFGRWIFLSTAATFIALQIDRLLLGGFVPEEELGIYSVALALALMPREVVGQLAQRVYYPLVASALRDHEHAKVRELRWKLMSLLIVPVACTIGVAVPLIELLYDDRYHDAGPLMAVLSIDTWLSILQMGYGMIAMGRGEPRFATYGTVVKTIVFGVGFMPIFHAWGVVGVAGLVCLSTIAPYATTAYAAAQVRAARLGLDLVMSAAVIGIAIGAYTLHGVIERATGASLLGIVILGVIAVGVPGALLATKRVRLL
ncbi:oligosaccharide flippase family protein [Sandaracinus amylolyticus]|nr:oligosaccharide flippase family protein [Sandaracinus amylolyticus]